MFSVALCGDELLFCLDLLAMSWLDLALALTKKSEGCRLEAYPDPVSGGKPWTIGYGATGPGVTKSLRWTQEQADLDLAVRLGNIGESLDSLVHVKLRQQQKAALADFMYNEGETNFSRSLVLKRLNSGDYEGAGNALLNWDMACGEVVEGLKKRREAERELFLS